MFWGRKKYGKKGKQAECFIFMLFPIIYFHDSAIPALKTTKKNIISKKERRKKKFMKRKIVGLVILMLVATTVVSATNINVKEKIRPQTTSVDVPVWTKGDSWTYHEYYIQYVYLKNGKVWFYTSCNYTTNYTVTDDTAGNYTLKMTSTNDNCVLTIGLFRMKLTHLTKWTKETILRKTDLAYVKESYQEKGLVFWLITKMNIPIPAQYSDTYEITYNSPGVLFPFPMNAGTNGTLPNSSWTGHQKIALYWGLIKLIDGDFSDYSGEQNYTCEMTNISVPTGTYDAYNVSVMSTFGIGHSISWSYYTPEVGWIVKQYIDNSWNETGIPGVHYECELVSTTYTP